MDLATQRVQDAQHMCQSHRGLTRLQLHDKAHTDPCRQGQLRLRERELLAGGADGLTQLLW